MGTKEYIVVEYYPCGHKETYYIAVPATWNSSDKDTFVYNSFGWESGQSWRSATPAERERKYFEVVEVMTVLN